MLGHVNKMMHGQIVTSTAIFKNLERDALITNIIQEIKRKNIMFVGRNNIGCIFYIVMDRMISLFILVMVSEIPKKGVGIDSTRVSLEFNLS